MKENYTIGAGGAKPAKMCRMVNKLFLAVTLLALALATQLSAQKKVFNATPPSASRPFSDAILAGDTLYLSGKLGLDAKGEAPASFEEEARNALQAQGVVLKAAFVKVAAAVLVQ